MSPKCEVAWSGGFTVTPEEVRRCARTNESIAEERPRECGDIRRIPGKAGWAARDIVVVQCGSCACCCGVADIFAKRLDPRVFVISSGRQARNCEFGSVH